ncbi:unnamed protein product, partial [Prunus brigantina]
MELKVRSLRVTERPGQEEDYAQAMAQELEDLEQSRLDGYNLIKAQKQIATRAYNRKVKQKTFAEGNLVWRAVLPIGTKDPRFGKFLPNWEGPFIIERVLGQCAFQQVDDSSLGGTFIAHIFTDRGQRKGRHSGRGSSWFEAKAVVTARGKGVTQAMGKTRLKSRPPLTTWPRSSRWTWPGPSFWAQSWLGEARAVTLDMGATEVLSQTNV